MIRSSRKDGRCPLRPGRYRRGQFRPWGTSRPNLLFGRRGGRAVRAADSLMRSVRFLEEAARRTPSASRRPLEWRSRKLEKSPDGANTVRLTACLEAAGVKSKTRGARINVDDIGHDALTIVVHFPGNIATKPHSPCTREVSRGTKKRLWSERVGQSRRLIACTWRWNTERAP